MAGRPFGKVSVYFAPIRSARAAICGTSGRGSVIADWRVTHLSPKAAPCCCKFNPRPREKVRKKGFGILRAIGPRHEIRIGQPQNAARQPDLCRVLGIAGIRLSEGRADAAAVLRL